MSYLVLHSNEYYELLSNTHNMLVVDILVQNANSRLFFSVEKHKIHKITPFHTRKTRKIISNAHASIQMSSVYTRIVGIKLNSVCSNSKNMHFVNISIHSGDSSLIDCEAELAPSKYF